MRIVETALNGVFSIEASPHRDARGVFARYYCPEEFHKAGIAFTSTQINLSGNPRKHTLRGLHYQPEPFAEAKLVRAVRGRAFDVVVDIRAGSATRGQWISVELSADAMNAVFVPEGCAHGFLTLEDDTDILYQMGRPFEPGHAAGYRWNDPTFAIDWPAEPAVIGDADQCWPEFSVAG
ncbi:dTDP-4-dehydrorhamnose 3,5-epimerase family protein [Breoghania sp. L-A4]|uniref:dTDP-4-dehydrorhamnose 3,5-epimerase family protein n=1 Tax=Breoghania sp. L-A4 TaxID=2304600 RepID=UPI000E3587F9|nr:dTDP-4-dehydrorhamnose 3,5-epimerase family protein [Breoghania sp. L-A4]AXS40435.1 dTDP-4-keto-6-deoxy-D-glucose epimerase [Breoghania sp. L-A4]